MHCLSVFKRYICDHVFCFPGFAVAHVAQHNPSTSSPSGGPTGPCDSVTASSTSTHTATQSQTGSTQNPTHATPFCTFVQPPHFTTNCFHWKTKTRLTQATTQKHPPLNRSTYYTPVYQVCKEADCTIIFVFSHSWSDLIDFNDIQGPK